MIWTGYDLNRLWVTEWGWRYAPEAHGGFWGFWKSQLVEFCLGRRRLVFTCSPKPGQGDGVGADGKASIERLCISLPYVDTFNSKVIKGFVPELRSRYVFYVYMLRTCYVRFTHIRIWLWYIKGFRTIVFIFIVISTRFWPIRPLAFFRCLSNSGTFTELQTTSFIESMGVACSDSISHNQVQVLSIPVLLLTCSQDWTCNLQMIVSLEA